MHGQRAPAAPAGRQPSTPRGTGRAVQTEKTAAAYKPSPRLSFPSGFLSTGALAPTARKLPFLAVALVGLAILLLALGALPARVVPSPAFAEALVQHRALLAFGGFATLAAAVSAYLLI